MAKKILMGVMSFSLSGICLFAQPGETLKQDTRFKIQGGYITFKSGTTVTYHKNHSIESGYMSNGLVYNYQKRKILFLANPQKIYFHPNGAIRMGSIGVRTYVPTKVGLLPARANTGISFHDNGQVDLIISDGDLKINGAIFKANTQIYFHKKNGAFHYGTLESDQRIKGITFKGGTYLYFHDNGKIAEGTVAVDTTVKKGLLKLAKKTLKAGKTYKFDRNGNVK